LAADGPEKEKRTCLLVGKEGRTKEKGYVLTKGGGKDLALPVEKKKERKEGGETVHSDHEEGGGEGCSLYGTWKKSYTTRGRPPF